ncbi:MAG TPA: response regulator, partial [Synergistaceae bacterium]|nr:response regulator [Synergistaceae bacterium]
ALAHYGIVAALIDRLGVEGFLDRRLAEGEGKAGEGLSPGKKAKALLFQAPGFFGETPPFVGHSLEALPLGRLLGTEIPLAPSEEDWGTLLGSLGRAGISELYDDFAKECLIPLLPPRGPFGEIDHPLFVRGETGPLGGGETLFWGDEGGGGKGSRGYTAHTVMAAEGVPLYLELRPRGEGRRKTLPEWVEGLLALPGDPHPWGCSWSFGMGILKDDDIVAGAIFLWAVARAVRALGEREIQEKISPEILSWRGPGGLPRTMPELLRFFSRVTLLRSGEEGREPEELAGLSQGHDRLLALLGEPFERYYRAVSWGPETWKKSENRLRILSRAIEESPVGVLIADPHGTIEYANPRFLEMTGFPLQELVGQTPRVLKSGRQDEAFYRDLWDTILDGREWRGELCNKRKDGSFYWARASIYPVRCAKGNVTHFVAIQVDVTKALEAEAELARARDAADAANRAKSAFLARMSHEIRTPMNGILGMAEILQGTELSSRQHRYLDIIQTSAESLLDIINDILDLSKIEAGAMTLIPAPFDLLKTAEDVMLLMAARARSKGLELVLRYDPETPRRVVGDGGRLRQVMVNLVGNAVKFTDEGHVVLGITSSPLGGGRMTLYLRVADTGVGIAPEDQSRIFEPFSQADNTSSRRYQGTGLGLSISRQLVDLMGGSMAVQSRLGEGTTFSVAIPAGMAPEAEETEERSVTPVIPGKRALVVDDVAPNRLLLEEVLKTRGFDVISVDSAPRARHALWAAEREGRPFSLLLTDRHMPGEDGLALVRSLPGILQVVPPCVLLSSLGDEEEEEEKEPLLAEVMTKPLRQTQIDAMLGRIFLGGEKTLPEGGERLSLGLRVLLAEDHPVNQEVGRALLARAGCTADVAENGKEAVRRYQESPGRYDVILMDCQMPEMDGYEATRRIRALEEGGRHLPILALTASATEDERRRCLDAGMDDVLAKPISLSALTEALGRYAKEGEEGSEGGVLPPEAPKAAPPSPVDRSVLADEVGDDPELVGELYRHFLATHREDMALMEKTLAEGDREALRRAAHRIKGAAASVGARPLAKASEDLERHGLEGREEEILALAERVRQSSQEVQRFLELSGETPGDGA